MQKPISILISSILFLSSCTLVSGQATSAEPLAKITVEAGDYKRVDTPVSVALDGVPIGSAGEKYRLMEVKGTEQIEVPMQLEAGSPPRLWWVLSGTTPAGGKRIYELHSGASSPAVGVSVEKDDEALTIKKGETKVLRYNHAIVPAPKDMGKVPEERRQLYNRSGFIHPLWSPKGNVLTDIHPPDHIHHVGIWMPWTHTQYEGKLVDFWNIDDGTGTVRFAKFLSTTEGPVYGGFQAEQEHVALKTSAGEKVILKEVWDVRVYNIGGPEKGYWLWDFKSTQRNITELPLIQEEYRYGGFGFRGSREWKGQIAAYLTSEGKTRVDGHATRARWCDLSGSIDTNWEGVAILSHPKNFRHPEPMRIWPESEDNIFFNFAPSQAGEWEMKPGEDHVFRYRLYVHVGKVNVKDNERIWKDYAEPPKVKVEAAGP